MTQDQAGSSTQHALQASKRPLISSGTISPLPPRQARNVSLQPNTPSQPNTRSRTRSRTGSLPPLSKERNAQHLPEVPPYPHPDEDLEDTPQSTPVASATPVSVDNEISKEPRHVEKTVRIRASGETHREEDEAHLRSMLDRLTTLEAIAEAREPTDFNDQLQKRILEDMRVLRRDVNTILEDRSQSDRRQDGEQDHLAFNPQQEVSVNPEVQLGPLLGNPPVERAQRISTVDSDAEAPAQRPQTRSSRRTNRSRQSRGSSTRNSRRTMSRVKHDDSTDTDSTYSTDEDERAPTFSLNIHQRKKGPKHHGLDSLVPSDERFDRLMSYRYYRLLDTTSLRTHETTSRLHKTLKNIELTMKEHKFSGEDAILVFDFLSRVVEEADVLGMNEGQLVTCFPHLLTKRAAQAYRAIASRGRGGSLTKWPEAVQYFLRTYGTDRAIQEAVETLESLRQTTNEDEDSFAARVGIAAYRCGNIHTESEKIGFFINGLQPAIRSIVSRFRRDQPRSVLTFDRVVSFARDEGDAYRARVKTTRAGTSQSNSRGNMENKLKRLVTFADHITDSFDTDSEAQLEEGQAMLAEGNNSTPGNSVPTEEVPPEASDEEEAILAMEKAITQYRQKRWNQKGTVIKPAQTAFDNGSKPGWKVDRSKTPICYQCYESGHYSSDCRSSIGDFAKIVLNFQGLSADNRPRVLSKNYKLACRLADPEMVDNIILSSVEEESEPKTSKGTCRTNSRIK